MTKFGPKAQLTSAINKWGKYYTERVQAVLNGTWKSEDIWYGIEQDMVDISKMNDAIPKDVQQLVMAKREEFVKGAARPFDGPVKDQAGTVRVPSGKALEDKEQLAMNWYVQGIEGSIPKAQS